MGEVPEHNVSHEFDFVIPGGDQDLLRQVLLETRVDRTGEIELQILVALRPMLVVRVYPQSLGRKRRRRRSSSCGSSHRRSSATVHRRRRRRSLLLVA